MATAQHASQGRQVVLTARRAGPLAGLLRDAGLRVLHRPLIAVEPVAVPALVVPAAAVVLVTSRAAVAHGGAVLQELAPGRRVVAVGPATARALQDAGIRAEVAPGGTGPAVLAAVDGPAVFVGAQRPAPAMAAALQRRPGLQHWPVYDRVRVPDALAGAVLEDDAVVVFASPSAVGAWCGATWRRPVAVAIGPTTASALEGRGFAGHAVAARPTPAALAAAVLSAPWPG